MNESKIDKDLNQLTNESSKLLYLINYIYEKGKIDLQQKRKLKEYVCQEKEMVFNLLNNSKDIDKFIDSAKFSPHSILHPLDYALVFVRAGEVFYADQDHIAAVIVENLFVVFLFDLCDCALCCGRATFEFHNQCGVLRTDGDESHICVSVAARHLLDNRVERTGIKIRQSNRRLKR